MDSKTLFAMATNLMLGGILCISWHYGINGTVTTAIIGMIGLITGSILGFKFGKNSE